MLKTLKIAALSLIISTGVASASTIDGTASLGGTYATTDGLALVIGSTLDLDATVGGSADGTGSYVGISPITTPFSLEASVGANVGTAFTFPAFDFEISSTVYAFKVLGATLVGGLGFSVGPGFDPSISSWLLTIPNAQAEGAWTIAIMTPPDGPPGQGPDPVPLPAGLPLLIGGLAMFGFLRKRASA